MIGVSAKILVESGTYLNVGQSENFYNNNGSKEIDFVMDRAFLGETPFMLGCSDFSRGATLISEPVDFFVGDQKADHNGRFDSIYKLTIYSPTPTSTLSFVFDSTNNRHPETILIDGIEYDVSNYEAVFSVEELQYHTIVIDNWNTPNFPLCIQGISSDVAINIDFSEVISLNFSGDDRSDATEPCFGIKSNSGTIQFIERSGAIKELVTSRRLLGEKIEIFLTNRYRNTLIGTFYITDGDYSTQGYSTNLSFQDNLEEWQNVDVPYDVIASAYEMSLEDFRREVTSTVKGLDITMYYFGNTDTWWNTIKLKAPFVTKSSFWAFMTKCCELTGSYISCDAQGRAMIAQGGGT